VEKFLEIESSTSKLLAELEDLRRETVTLNDANGTLTGVAQRLATLLESTAAATREIATTASALREIGTPQIMEKFAQADQQSVSLARDLTSAIGENQMQTARAVESAAGGLSNLLQATAQDIAKQSSELMSRIDHQDQRINALGSTVNRIGVDLHGSMSRMTTFLWVVAGFGLLGIVVDIAEWLMRK
jgi:ABC-type transporter Mla subunit MlaD